MSRLQQGIHEYGSRQPSMCPPPWPGKNSSFFDIILNMKYTTLINQNFICKTQFHPLRDLQLQFKSENKSIKKRNILNNHTQSYRK